MALAWGEPPRARGRPRRFNWERISAELKANPEVFAQVATQVPKSVATAVRRGKVNAMKRDDTGRYEVRTRNQRRVDGKPVADVWVRWTTTTEEEA